MTLTDRFRATILPMAHTKLNHWFIRQLFYHWDQQQMFESLSRSATPQSPYRAAYQEYLNGHKNLAKGLRAVDIDTSFEVIYFPYHGQVYGIYYTEDRDFSTHWMSQPEIHDFHYQNNTDRPDRISEDDWEHRRHIWKSLFASPLSTPALCGLTSTILPDTLSPEFETFEETYLTYAPSLDSRAQAIGYQAALNRLMTAPFSFEEFHRVERLLRTPDYHALLESEIATARDRLTPIPAFADFHITPPHSPAPRPIQE